MNNFERKGDTIDFVLDGTKAAGDLVTLTDRAGVATIDGGSGDEIPVLVEGVVRVTNKALGVWSGGDKLYYHSSNGVTTSSSGAKALGWAAAPAASTDTEGLVKLGAF